MFRVEIAKNPVLEIFKVRGYVTNYPSLYNQNMEDTLQVLMVRVLLQYRAICSLSLGTRAGCTLREAASKTSSIIQLATINILSSSFVLLDHQNSGCQGCAL